MVVGGVGPNRERRSWMYKFFFGPCLGQRLSALKDSGIGC
jgi:hypothetical protein